MTEKVWQNPLDNMSPAKRREVSVLFSAGVALVFFVLAFPFRDKISHVNWGNQPTYVDLVMTTLVMALFAGALAYGLCHMLRHEKLPVLALALITVCAGMFIRYLALDHVTADYTNFLAQWAATFRNNGWSAIKMEFADYNMPYLYIVAVIAKIPMQEMFLFKLTSIMFDCALVMAAVRLGKTLKMSGLKLSILVASIWLAPTMWLNSAFWAQCDSIYVFFIVMALTTALEEKPVFSMIFAAIAFSFKLQTVFFLPVYVVIWFAKKMKLWHFAVFPVAYVATVLPAWFSGKPLPEILKVYLKQTGTYSDRLNLNSPSMYAMLWTDGSTDKFFFVVGLVLAVALMCLVFLWMGLKRKRLNNTVITLCALLFSVGIPWLLPSMHERYFYISDILCIFVAVLIPKRWFIAPFSVFASYAGYHAYLFLVYLPYVGLIVPSFVLLLTIGTVFYEMWYQTSDHLATDAAFTPPPALDEGFVMPPALDGGTSSETVK